MQTLRSADHLKALTLICQTDSASSEVSHKYEYATASHIADDVLQRCHRRFLLSLYRCC
jgi:hypothetical protein